MAALTMESSNWVAKVEERVKVFAERYSASYCCEKRELYASFEIGCFQALVAFYDETSTVTVQNLIDGRFRYLTSPNGNPKNFSYVEISNEGGNYQLRQQVRVRSHIDRDIAFTPDIVVIRASASICGEKDENYAGGRRTVFSISSDDVIAAHECKSLNPFPELVISFLGMFISAHPWAENQKKVTVSDGGLHLAPTLFVGGAPSGFHRKMIEAIERCYPLNVITNLHYSNWRLSNNSDLKRLNDRKSLRSRRGAEVLTMAD